MIASSAKVVVNVLGRGILIILPVVFLTLAFNFLGTVLCSVGIGLMMGAARGRRWQAGLAALIFPAVILTLARAARLELPEGQVGVMAAVCFGGFWFMYLLGALMMAAERRTHDARGAGAEPTRGRDGAVPGGAMNIGQTGQRLAPETAAELDLEILQGKWARESWLQNGGSRRVLEIREDELTLRAIGPQGGDKLIGRTRLKLVPAARPTESAVSAEWWAGSP